LHLEGPFLNPQAHGAHDRAHLSDPSSTAIESWSRAAGVAMVTLAPELPGALHVIEELTRRDVVVAAGHSRATYDVAGEAIRAGVRHGTHLFNAMGPLGHREPGLVGALLDDPSVSVGLIADGVHVHPAMVRLAYAIKGPERRLALVTDAIAALGAGEGRYRLGSLDVEVGPTGVWLQDGTLAGTAIEPCATVRNLMAFTGCPLPDAIAGWTSTPARLLDLSRKGSIAPGFDADLVLLTEELEVRATIIDGWIVYEADARDV
jgi:N-acetylglucosamine-6-phosphate deacetylase